MEGKLKPSFRIAPWHRPLSAFLALALLLLFSGAGAGDKSALELFGARKDMALGSPGFSSPRFSPDGKLLAFDFCDKSRCENAIYDIANDRYFAYRDKQGRRITNVSFSPSGRKLTFVVKEQKGFLWWAEPQDRIAVGSVPDNRFTFITSPESATKRYPEFWREEAVLFIGEDPTDTGRRKRKYLYMAGWTAKPCGRCSRISTPLPHDHTRLVSTVLRARDRFGTVSTLYCRSMGSAKVAYRMQNDIM